MKIAESRVEVIFWSPDNGWTLEEAIERAARTCWKSDGKIDDGSAERLIRKLKKRGHYAMLEFGFIMAKIVADRGLSHELVRHRLASFAQMSTRYCNFYKEKFCSEISVIEPPGLNEDQRKIWKSAMQESEKHYMDLIISGAKSEISRSVLPIGLMTEIVIGANPREWMKIFELRCSKHAHPIIRSIMIEIFLKCRDRYPSLFDDMFQDMYSELSGKILKYKDKNIREIIFDYIVDKS